MLFASDFTYISNPKTASTSVHDTLMKAGYGIPANQRHIPPHQIHWDSKRVFVTNVRHPADRLVSVWAYTAKNAGVQFDKWLRGRPHIFGGVDIKRTSQHYWAQDEVAIILRFERLEEDWAALLERFSLPFVPLSHERKSDHPHYADVLTEDDWRIIKDRFAYDFEQWGYD